MHASLHRQILLFLVLLAGLLSPALAAEGLYVTAYRDPCRALELNWLCPIGAPPATAAWRIGDGPWTAGVLSPVAELPGTGHGIRRWELTDLAPESTLTLRIGGREERVATLPAQGPYRIANGGDTMHRPEFFARMNSVMAALDPHLALLGGDLAYENGKDGARILVWIQVWDSSARRPDGRLIPLIAAIGNHEVQGHYGGTPAKAPYFFAMFPLFDGRPYGAVDIGAGLTFILLDTDHVTPIARQTPWLEEALRSRPGRVIIPAYHYPAWGSVKVDKKGQTPAQHPRSQAIQRDWCGLFEQHGVRVVLEHDHHAYKRSQPMKGTTPDASGITYLGDGAWGVETRHPIRDLPYMAKVAAVRHGILLTIDGQRIEARMVDENGQEFDRWSSVAPEPPAAPAASEPAATP